MAKRQYKEKNKNLRKMSVVVTSQTKWHLGRICAANNWGEKDMGRAIDFVMKRYLRQREYTQGGKPGGELPRFPR